MFLIDTCGWIEWITNGQLSEKYEKFFHDIENLLTPTAIQFELYKWVCANNGQEKAIEAVALTEQTQIIPLDSAITLLAADLAIQHKLSFADSIIYATARYHHATLITSDNHFEDLEHVVYFKKAQ